MGVARDHLPAWGAAGGVKAAVPQTQVGLLQGRPSVPRSLVACAGAVPSSAGSGATLRLE